MNATGGVILMLLGVLALWLIWQTSVIDQMIGAAGRVRRVGGG